MIRTTIVLTAAQRRGLREVGRESGLSFSSLLRIFVTEGLARRRRQQAASTVIRGSARRQAQAELGE